MIKGKLNSDDFKVGLKSYCTFCVFCKYLPQL